MKKGFTLVEIIAVIAILAIVLTFSVSMIYSIKDRAKESLYNEQVKRIERVAENWAIENINLLPVTETEIYKLTLEKLVQDNFLDDSEIRNPNNKEVLKGCVYITYINQKYRYKYEELCN